VTGMFHHLRLRRIRNCEAEGQNECKQNLFHTLLSGLLSCRSELL
jgi:hypothetical protein